MEEAMEVQALFRCNSGVACFDISPQQEFMVCECRDGTIQLWSVQTGKQIWKRPVKFGKRYVDDLDGFRVVPESSVLSCYRSVVFHPTKSIVLPGILSHAYSIDGAFLPLFPNSNCGWPPVVHTTRGVANNQHERPKRSLFTGPRYNTFFLLLSSWILSPEITI